MKQDVPGFFSSPALVYLTALFVCGAVAGCFTGLLAVSGGADIARLSGALAARAAKPPDGRNALCAALGALGWQAAALAAGWMGLSSLVLSLLCTVRGFTLSFSVAALYGLGAEGVWRSLAATGASAVVTVPCLLLTAAACLQAAQDAPRGRRGGYFYALGRRRRTVLVCTAAAVWAGVLQRPFGWMVERWIL